MNYASRPTYASSSMEPSSGLTSIARTGASERSWRPRPGARVPGRGAAFHRGRRRARIARLLSLSYDALDQESGPGTEPRPVLHDPSDGPRECALPYPCPRSVYAYERSHDGVYCRRLLRLKTETQRRERLMNLASVFSMPGPMDPAHEDSLLSAFVLAKETMRSHQSRVSEPKIRRESR